MRLPKAGRGCWLLTVYTQVTFGDGSTEEALPYPAAPSCHCPVSPLRARWEILIRDQVSAWSLWLPAWGAAGLGLTGGCGR